MKNLSIVFLLMCTGSMTNAQKIPAINVSSTERIEKILSADDMMGRKPFTPGIEKAAGFIASEFKQSRLDFFPGLESYFQVFTMVKPKFISARGNINGNSIAAENIIAVTTSPVLEVTQLSSFTRLRIDSSLDLLKEAARLLKFNKNYLVFIDSVHAKTFGRLKRYKRETFKMTSSVIFILTDQNPVTFDFDIRHEVTGTELSNVVAMIPGRSKPEELVVFSAHYDHLGVGKLNAAGDSIYNGANDDASGTTAVMMLADHFNKLKTNERTLIFAAFTAEESGGFGSKYFSTQVNQDKVVAMFNIEMIGTDSKWGLNSAYITGFEKSTMGTILQANLGGSGFSFNPDPYPDQKLFYRSDNATLAALGVPAHTISTSKMDDEKFYHTQGDEIQTLDLVNMTEIIKAIAASSTSIISGKDTPSRILE